MLAIALACSFVSILQPLASWAGDVAATRQRERPARVAQKAPRAKIEGVSSGFGVRRDPINNRRDFHKGIDIPRPSGTEVLAWSAGIVVKAGWRKGYGKTVDILHADGVTTRYSHLRRILVQEGWQIVAGAVLGQIGRTGRTSGANLHFEVIVDGKTIDPTSYIADASQIVCGFCRTSGAAPSSIIGGS